MTVTKAGFAPKTQHVHSGVAGAGVAGMAGNAVLGGVIGIVVDEDQRGDGRSHAQSDQLHARS